MRPKRGVERESLFWTHGGGLRKRKQEGKAKRPWAKARKQAAQVGKLMSWQGNEQVQEEEVKRKGMHKEQGGRDKQEEVGKRTRA